MKSACRDGSCQFCVHISARCVLAQSQDVFLLQHICVGVLLCIIVTDMSIPVAETSAGACVLGLRVRIPPGARMCVSFEFCQVEAFATSRSLY